MNAFPYIVGLAALAVFLVQWWRLSRKQTEVFDEFEEKFPGRCGVCAFHEFRVREGHVGRFTVPEKHRCKEGLRRFQGVLH